MQRKALSTGQITLDETTTRHAPFVRLIVLVSTDDTFDAGDARVADRRPRRHYCFPHFCSHFPTIFFLHKYVDAQRTLETKSLSRIMRRSHRTFTGINNSHKRSVGSQRLIFCRMAAPSRPHHHATPLLSVYSTPIFEPTTTHATHSGRTPPCE